MEKIFLGIDVGTGNVRAGAFNRRGRLKAKCEHPIRILKPKPGFVEQSPEDIWKAAAKAIGQCLVQGKISAENFKGPCQGAFPTEGDVFFLRALPI